MATRAYSYVRFSSLKQKHGASADRQLEAATKYAHTHDLILDTSTYKDLGVSAFRSKNVESALGAFIQAVDSGKVSKGSYLLIESLDRLSRDSVDVALELFLSIIRKGIVIVTLTDGQVYSSATIRDNWTKFVVALSIMAGANEQSVIKSQRAHDAYQRRAQRGELPTTRLPTWMKFAGDRKTAALIPTRAKIVRRIFDDAIDGHGSRQIARELNAEKIPVLFYATEWRQSAISQLLKNPATYGEFKGEIRLPAVITRARFMKAQQVVRDRTLYKGGFSRSNPNNTFVGLAKCGHCQRPMRYLPRTDGSVYLKCVGSADNGICNGRLFPFNACETALVVHLTLAETNLGLTRTIFAERHEQSQHIEGEIEVITSKQERLLKLAEVSGDVDILGAQLKKLQGELVQLTKQQKDLGASIGDNDDSVSLFSDYSALLHDVPEITAKSAASLVELRRKLKMAFVRVLKRVEFLNGNEDKWQPTLKLTYINERTAVVDVTPFLSERTLLRIANGVYHRSDIKKPSTKRRSKAA